VESSLGPDLGHPPVHLGVRPRDQDPLAPGGDPLDDGGDLLGVLPAPKIVSGNRGAAPGGVHLGEAQSS